MAEGSKEVVVVGAGGHAKVVVATLRAAGRNPTSIYDDWEGAWGSSVLGVPVEGPISELEGRDLESPFGVVALGDNQVRRDVAASLSLNWISVVHPHATVHESVKLGEGTVVFAGAIVQPDTVVGAHAIVNTGASVDHDCRLGDFCHVAPGVRIGGEVTVGEGALVGIGSSVIPGRKIGAWSVVGAGSAVVRDIPERTTAIGIPARPYGRR